MLLDKIFLKKKIRKFMAKVKIEEECLNDYGEREN